MFYHDFKFDAGKLAFNDEDIKQLDAEVLSYEDAQLNPDIEKSLITQNQFLASFGISKAEDSTLTLTEATDVYGILESDKNYDFLARKIKNKIKLTKKDYEKLEFVNIARVFKETNQHILSPKDLNSATLRDIHGRLTVGMDVFHKYSIEFTPYKSGKFRDNDLIRVNTYVPPPYRQISSLVQELIEKFKSEMSITTVLVFHALLYAIHPFNNGNKRVCRILEHILLRTVGLNQRNFYSPSYYYHLEKSRYYKYLLATLERKNLNFFVLFCQEALVSSLILVFKRGLEFKREAFVKRFDLSQQTKAVIKPLTHRCELQFNQLYSKKIRNKMARQTFVNILDKACEAGVLKRREQGRNVFYGLNIDALEEQMLAKWITFARPKLDFVSDHVTVF